MEGDDGIPVPGRVAQDGEAQAGAGDPGSQGGPGGHEGPGSGGSVEAEVVAREAEEVAREAPQVAQALDNPGPRADADAQPGSLARIQRRVSLHFVLLVPFRSSIQAEIACHLLAFSSQPEPGAAQQEVWVSGRRLAIRLTAEDMDQMQVSIISCLQELFVLIETMQHILPQFFSVNPRTMNGG